MSIFSMLVFPIRSYSKKGAGLAIALFGLVLLANNEGKAQIPALNALSAPADSVAGVHKGYLLFPIMPGKQNFLVGNMGELRANHFHSGLDIKTAFREGLPVYASADGYVSRIKIATGGYGNCLYITHPNGLVTVYAHLRELNIPIGSYLRRKQYEQHSFEIDLEHLQPSELPIRQGDVIAYSGNTGASSGPHLHYEVRDIRENVLNPLYIGFKEIKDNVPPVFERIALRTLEINARVKGDFGRQELVPQKTGAATYTIAQAIPAYGTIGLEVLISDQSNDVNNKNGVTCVEVAVNGQTTYYHQLASFAFDVSRHINVHMDYAAERILGRRFQRCYVADGNKLNIYRKTPSQGKIVIPANSTNRVTVTIWDAYNNQSKLNFTIIGQASALAAIPVALPSKGPANIRYTVEENTLVLRASRVLPESSVAQLYLPKTTSPLPYASVKNNEVIYLWDLRKGLPDSVQISGKTEVFHFRQAIASQRDILYKSDSLQIAFTPESLFDTLYLETHRVGNRLEINNLAVPLLEGITVQVTPRQPIANKSKTAAYLLNAGRKRYLTSSWEGSQLIFKTRELGTFEVITDTIPPVARLVQKNKEAISLTISDNLSGIKSFSATVNGQWLLMQYDYKKSLIWSDKLNPSVPLSGAFVLELIDNAGNTTVYKTTI